MTQGKSSLHSTCKGEHGINLMSQRGNRTSRRVEGGVSRSFSSCGRKHSVLSTCDGDLRERLMVAMGIQEYFGDGRDLSGLHCGWCNVKGPHLDLRRETQGSPPVLTWVSVCI